MKERSLSKPNYEVSDPLEWMLDGLVDGRRRIARDLS